MQKVIQDLIKQMSKDGIDKDQITIYLQGAFDGIDSFSTSLKDSKLEIHPKENDPLFIHTWNHVINLLAKRMDKMVLQALEGIPKELGVTYAGTIRRNKNIDSVDEELSAKCSTEKQD